MTPAPRVHIQKAIDKYKETGKTIIGPVSGVREIVSYVSMFTSGSCLQKVPLGEFKDMKHTENAFCCGKGFKCWKYSVLINLNPFDWDRPYHKVSGDSCCDKRPFFKRKQVCCEDEIINKRKYECCDNKKIEKATQICCAGKAHARYPGAKCCSGKGVVYNSNKYECCGDDIFKLGALIGRNDFCCGSTTYRYFAHFYYELDHENRLKQDFSYDKFPGGCCNNELLTDGKNCCNISRWQKRTYSEQKEICCDGVFSRYLFFCKISNNGEKTLVKLNNDQRKTLFDVSIDDVQRSGKKFILDRFPGRVSLGE
jgi:hypothetical protein